MSTFSEEIKARYDARESETDEFGRTIMVKRLKPAESQAIRRLADSDRPGVLGDSMIAACVREIDGRPFPCPRTLVDLDAVFNALDTEGLQAAARAWARLMKLMVGEEQADQSLEEKAKNELPTPA